MLKDFFYKLWLTSTKLSSKSLNGRNNEYSKNNIYLLTNDY